MHRAAAGGVGVDALDFWRSESGSDAGGMYMKPPPPRRKLVPLTEMNGSRRSRVISVTWYHPTVRFGRVVGEAAAARREPVKGGAADHEGEFLRHVARNQENSDHQDGGRDEPAPRLPPHRVFQVFGARRRM